MARKIISVRVATGSAIANLLHTSTRSPATRVHGADLPATGADPMQWYLVKSCVAYHNSGEIIFTLEATDPPPKIEPAPQPAEPSPAELMREIKVLQDMVARLSRDLFAHGAPLSVQAVE